LETQRIESFKEIAEALKKLAEDETKFIKRVATPRTPEERANDDEAGDGAAEEEQAEGDGAIVNRIDT
jgi:hypothetical protein